MLFKKSSATDRAFIQLSKTNPEVRLALSPIVKEAVGWDKLPKGWTQESVEKFWNSLVGDVKHQVTKCIKRMEKHIDDPGAFCSSLKDQIEGNTNWRKGPRKKKQARADVTPMRQRTQYSCMATSLTMCLQAHGVDVDEDTVNKVMGATPMQGATWEQAIAAAQHFGFRIHMTVPSTIKQLKEWTDQGIPIMIAWNPENRDWSHASVVFDVDDQDNVYVADPNIPDPDQTVRVVSREDFYKKWFEKWPKYLVRRPAMAILREITPDGQQVKFRRF